MRQAAKIDANQPAIVEALRKAGASVLSLAALGKGAPDLCVGHSGKTILMEIKNPATSRGKKGANGRQQSFMETWKGGPVSLVDGPEAALRALGVLRG